MISSATLALAAQAVKTQHPLMTKADADELTSVVAGMWTQANPHFDAPKNVYDIGPFVPAADQWMKYIGSKLPSSTVTSIPWDQIPWQIVPWWWIKRIVETYAPAPVSHWEKGISDAAKSSEAARIVTPIDWTVQSYDPGDPASDIPGSSPAVAWADIHWDLIPWTTMNWSQIPWSDIDWQNVSTTDMQDAVQHVSLAVLKHNIEIQGQTSTSTTTTNQAQNQASSSSSNQQTSQTQSGNGSGSSGSTNQQLAPTGPSTGAILAGVAIAGVAIAIFWATLAQKPGPAKKSKAIVPYSLRTGKRVSDAHFRAHPEDAYEWRAA